MYQHRNNFEEVTLYLFFYTLLPAIGSFIYTRSYNVRGKQRKSISTTSLVLPLKDLTIYFSFEYSFTILKPSFQMIFMRKSPFV